MDHGPMFSAQTKAVLASLSSLAIICALAPAQSPAQSRTVPLVSDTCPVVHPDDKVSFDVNPLFDPIWPVTGLRGFSVAFAKVADDGVHLTRKHVLMGGRHSGVNISSLGNGFFHIELTVAGSRSIEPGTYSLVEANANAEVVPDYAGQSPQMTSSPVDARYCITIVKSPVSQTTQPGG